MSRRPSSVTVCVVVRDRLVEMDRCLDHLLAQTRLPDEIVVGVSAHSVEPVADRLRSRAADSPVAIVVFEDGGSVSLRRNQAAARSSSEVIAWTDSDCLPDPQWIEAGLSAFDDERIGVVQGRTRPQQVEAPPGLRGAWASTLDVQEWSGLFETCNLFVRREAWAATGGFSEEIGFWCEDTLFGWEVMALGWRGRFAEAAVVEHATTYPGFAAVLRKAKLYAHWAIVLRESELARRELPHSRLFLRPRDRQISLAAAGLLVGIRWRPALLLVIPWLALRAPRDPSPESTVRAALVLAHDAVSFWWIVVGGVRARYLVL